MLKGLEKTENYLLHLLKCVVDNNVPCEKPSAVEWKNVYKAAVFHSVANMAFYAVEQLQKKPDDELYNKWREVRDKAIVRDIVQKQEFASLCKMFSDNGIRFLPLKGFSVKSLYPRQDQRMMSDLDFLIDEENADRIHDLMLDNGYTCEHFGMETHDVYQKAPIIDVEIHRNLVRKRLSALSRYYVSMMDKCTPSPENPFSMKMSEEDLYVYQIAHMSKHYSGGGFGIRSVLDVYLFKFKKSHLWDREKVSALLNDLELSDFEREVREIAEMWFGDRVYDDVENQKGDFIIKSGTYGTLANDVKGEIEKNGRVKYFFYRLFLDYDTLKYVYPVLKKHPVLLPVIQMRRIFSAIVKKPKKCLYLLKLFFKKKED